jgi:cell division protein FtsB
VSTREAPAPPRSPRPLLTFFVSLAASSAVLAILLLWDHRVLELKNARAEVLELDRQIAERTRENEELKVEIEAANRHQFPAEKVAREELHLVRGDDLVLLYPAGALTAPERKAATAAEKKLRR